MLGFLMRRLAASPESHSANEQPPKSFKRRLFGKEFVALIVVVAALIIVVAFFVPLGSAIIPLNVDYVVGEKMVYDTTLVGSIDFGDAENSGIFGGLPHNVSYAPQQTMEVVDFDGQYYTLNHTTTMPLGSSSYSYSILEKVNKTGYSSYFFNFGNETTEIPSGITGSTYLTQLLNKPEVHVGDTVTIPFPSTGIGQGITGNITMTFKGFEDLTVPAGTYRVFRIDVGTGDNGLNYHLQAGSSSLNLLSTVQTDLNFQMYLEYGTMRQIKSTMLETMSVQSSLMNYTMNMTMDMILKQDTLP